MHALPVTFAPLFERERWAARLAPPARAVKLVGSKSAEDQSVHVGARLFGRLRLDQLLDSGAGWSLFLADDEERSDLVLVVVAASTALLEARLAEGGPPARCAKPRAQMGAEGSLDERH